MVLPMATIPENNQLQEKKAQKTDEDGLIYLEERTKQNRIPIYFSVP